MIGIVAAHAIELAPLVRRLRGARHVDGVRCGTLGDTPVALAALGQGWARAEAAAARFLAAVPCDGLVITGFAGATQPGWAAGDVVIPETVVDARAVGGRQFRVPVPVQPLQRRAQGRGGVLGTVARVAASPREKSALGRAARLTAVDLESAAVASVAEARRMRWVVARIILDPAERPLGVASAAQAAALACSLVGWRRLWQFRRDLAAARRALGARVPLVVETMNR